jgi:hypothetical protein
MRPTPRSPVLAFIGHFDWATDDSNPVVSSQVVSNGSRSQKKAWARMRQAAGCPNAPGTRITTAAFLTAQLVTSGVTAIEHIKIKAVSIASPL